MHSWTIRARVVSWSSLSVSCHNNDYHIDKNIPAIGASVGTPGEKYVLVCARTSPARHKVVRAPAKERIVAGVKQQRYRGCPDPTHITIVRLPFYTCRTKHPNALPLIFPTMHMATLWSISQATRRWRCERADCTTSTCMEEVKLPAS